MSVRARWATLAAVLLVVAAFGVMWWSLVQAATAAAEAAAAVAETVEVLDDVIFSVPAPDSPSAVPVPR